jgi:hypothetical protein
MSIATLAHHKQPAKRHGHSEQMKDLSDEAAEIFRLHEAKEIDADEAARRLNELKSRYRTFLDRLVG